MSFIHAERKITEKWRKATTTTKIEYKFSCQTFSSLLFLIFPLSIAKFGVPMVNDSSQALSFPFGGKLKREHTLERATERQNCKISLPLFTESDNQIEYHEYI